MSEIYYLLTYLDLMQDPPNRDALWVVHSTGTGYLTINSWAFGALRNLVGVSELVLV